MRRIDPTNFRVATRGTSREINRRIALTLIRMKQPLSRADLARLMGMRRGAVSLIVNELIAEGQVFEGAKGQTPRGRKPQFLHIDSRQRCIVAVDVRASRTYLAITDLMGQPVTGIESYPPADLQPKAYLAELAQRVRQLLADHPESGACEGVGLAVPGMLDRTGGRVLFSPRLGWRDVAVREPLAAAIGLPVLLENSGKACALALMWSVDGESTPAGDLVFVSVSDGVGTGVMVGGALLRGRHNVAGEFGHVPLSIDGPPCACGATGCWETYVSNLATLSRFLGRSLAPDEPLPPEFSALTLEDVIAQARAGDAKALAALQSTGRYLGLGLASIVNAVDPARVYLGGEITDAWDLIATTVRGGLQQRVLFPAAGDVEIVVTRAEDHSRLRGAAALVAAPAFAAPVVA